MDRLHIDFRLDPFIITLAKIFFSNKKVNL